MVKMTTGKLTVKSVIKKTATEGFNGLAVGDSVEISTDFETGRYKSAPKATVTNLQTGEKVSRYFSTLGTVLDCFEWEEQ